MPTATTRSHGATPTLHLALDLGNTTWKLAFATGHAHAPRLRTIPARDLAQLAAEIAAAKARFGLAPDTPVVSCYEAVRDGFWVHRAPTAMGNANIVVGSASINENRRKRRAKSDRLDANARVALLLRHQTGERDVWSAVHVPSVAQEDRRQLHREVVTLTRERTRQVNRIKGLLALHSVVLPRVRGLPAVPPALRDWSGAPLPPSLTDRLACEWARLRATQRERRALRAERRRLLASADAAADPTLRMVAPLLALKGVGEVSAWLYTTECFGWRAFRNRRQVAGATGLTPTTRGSGDAERELGLSKAGSAIMRSPARSPARSRGAWCAGSPRARSPGGTARASPPAGRGNAASASSPSRGGS